MQYIPQRLSKFLSIERQDYMEEYFDVFPSEPNALLMLPGEKTILHRRQHVFAVIIPVGIAVVLALGMMAGLMAVMSFFPFGWHILLCAAAFIIVGTLSLITKTIIDWYLHMYIVTTRRILEVQYKPFFSQDVNDVLLDQVRCTEIDVKIRGYIHALMDIGDIIITFDRPTHEQEFVLHDITAPRKIGTLLGHLLNTPKSNINASSSWHSQTAGGQKRLIFSEELFPSKQFSSV